MDKQTKLELIEEQLSRLKHTITDKWIDDYLEKEGLELDRDEKIRLYKTHAVALVYDFHRYDHGERSYKARLDHTALFRKAQRNGIDPKTELFTYDEYKDFIAHDIRKRTILFVQIKKSRILNIETGSIDK